MDDKLEGALSSTDVEEREEAARAFRRRSPRRPERCREVPKRCDVS
ncbi:MAG: hypothetical protein ABEN55_06780 [Bradymonadaceae bacterium]